MVTALTKAGINPSKPVTPPASGVRQNVETGRWVTAGGKHVFIKNPGKGDKDYVDVHDPNDMDTTSRETQNSRVLAFSTGSGSSADKNVKLVTNTNLAGDFERGKVRVEIVDRGLPRKIFERSMTELPKLVDQMLEKNYEATSQYRRNPKHQMKSLGLPFPSYEMKAGNPNHAPSGPQGGQFTSGGGGGGGDSAGTQSTQTGGPQSEDQLPDDVKPIPNQGMGAFQPMTFSIRVNSRSAELGSNSGKDIKVKGERGQDKKEVLAQYKKDHPDLDVGGIQVDADPAMQESLAQYEHGPFYSGGQLHIPVHPTVETQEGHERTTKEWQSRGFTFNSDTKTWDAPVPLANATDQVRRARGLYDSLHGLKRDSKGSFTGYTTPDKKVWNQPTGGRGRPGTQKKSAPREVSWTLVGGQLGVDFEKISVDQWVAGCEHETEHLQTIGGDPFTVAHIAWDHLQEDPKYYFKLPRAEITEGSEKKSILPVLPPLTEQEIEALSTVTPRDILAVRAGLPETIRDLLDAR